MKSGALAVNTRFESDLYLRGERIDPNVGPGKRGKGTFEKKTRGKVARLWGARDELLNTYAEMVEAKVFTVGPRRSRREMSRFISCAKKEKGETVGTEGEKAIGLPTGITYIPGRRIERPSGIKKGGSFNVRMRKARHNTCPSGKERDFKKGAGDCSECTWDITKRIEKVRGEFVASGRLSSEKKTPNRRGFLERDRKPYPRKGRPLFFRNISPAGKLRRTYPAICLQVESQVVKKRGRCPATLL